VAKLDEDLWEGGIREETNPWEDLPENRCHDFLAEILLRRLARWAGSRRGASGGGSQRRFETNLETWAGVRSPESNAG